MSQDWREPFLGFQDKLRPLFDAGLTIGHCVILSVDRTESELQPIIPMLEPACSGRRLVQSIPVTTAGCQYHSHLFFADNRTGIDQLGRLVDDIELWMDFVPAGFVPAFDIPKCQNQVHQNLIRWISLVYYLAWSSEASYLFAELEYQTSIDTIGFFPWNECPQPPRCQPLEWLIHRTSAAGSIPKCKQQFADRGLRIPDVIDAYMTGEFVAASLAAIDLLVYVLPGKRRRTSLDTEDYAKRLSAKTPQHRKVNQDIENLKNFLLKHHNPWTNSDSDVDVNRPLTGKEIAVLMGWAPPENGLKRQYKASRLMKIIFGLDAMKNYRIELRRGNLDQSLRKTEGLSLLHHAIVDGNFWGSKTRKVAELE